MERTVKVGIPSQYPVFQACDPFKAAAGINFEN
jgi:hypothetical protein